MMNFEELIAAIGECLGPTSGLDSADVDAADLVALMQQYSSNEVEWRRYALGDPSRNYTRNLVDDTNGKSNILIVYWNPGKGSPIHDHADAHCVMKVLRGSVKETLYHTPDTEGTAPEITRVTTYHSDQVTYISDNIGLHKVENGSSTEPAITLHLYTPPHAATFGFNIFNENSGKKSRVKGSIVYSIHGKRMGQDVSIETYPSSFAGTSVSHVPVSA